MRRAPLPTSGRLDVKLLQDATGKALRDVQASPIVDGVHLDGVALLAAGVTRVNHGLGRMPQGYKVVSSNANSNVWNDALTGLVLPLRCSADVTVSLWVY